MKKLAFILIALSAFIVADYVEVKTGNGRDYIFVPNTPKLYVCYDKRVKYVTNNAIYLRYDGCRLYRHSCRYNGKAHFGKYPSQAAARRALYRCKNAHPRFID